MTLVGMVILVGGLSSAATQMVVGGVLTDRLGPLIGGLWGGSVVFYSGGGY